MLPTRPLPALIQGDAREVLRQLAADGLAGEVKLAYLDPPYNTRRSHRFRGHYQDNRTKPDWAALIEEVLSGVRDLLREDGSAWLQINASELGAAQQVAEKVFGRCASSGQTVGQANPPCLISFRASRTGSGPSIASTSMGRSPPRNGSDP
jgi:hypothetical protein